MMTAHEPRLTIKCSIGMPWLHLHGFHGKPPLVMPLAMRVCFVHDGKQFALRTMTCIM